MAIMAMDTLNNKKHRALYVSLLFCQQSVAGDWQFTPSISLDHTYSDNVNLNRANQVDSLVSQTSVNLESSYRAQYARFNWSSQSTYVLYSHDHDIDKGYIDLQSNFAVQLWPNGITLLGSANIENRAQNGSRNALADIVSADTTQIENYSAGVGYFVNNSDFELNVTLRYQDTHAKDNIGNKHGYLTQLNSNNGNSAKVIFWDVEASYQELENDTDSGRIHRGQVKIGWITPYRFNPFIRYYNEGNTGNIRSNQSIESNSYGVGLRWLLTERFYIDLSYNKPNDDAVDFDGKPQQNYIDTSVRWQPSVRTQLEANFSQRFYGDSYGLNISHKNKRLTNSINYTETVQAFTRNRYESIPQGLFWCPNSNEQTIDITQCLAQDNQTINFDDYSLVALNDFELVEDNQFSLNKSLNWTSTLALAKTQLVLSLDGNERKNLTDLQTDTVKNANVNLLRQLSKRSRFDLTLSYTENYLNKNTDDQRRDRYRQYQLSYQRNINNSLTSEVHLTYINRSSNEQAFNYKEGRFNVVFSKDF